MGITGESRGRGPAKGVTFAAQWDLTKYGWADIGHGVVLPERFTARFTIEGDHTVEMEIATEHGVPVCDELRVLRHNDRPSLSGHELRRLPIAEWVRFACSMVAIGNQGMPSTATSWNTEEYRKDMDGAVRRARRRNNLTDDFLLDVARIYKANADAAPIEAIRETHHAAHSTARKWVTLARERGFLPETTRGKVTAD
jgi:hypothetical protein